MDKEIMKQAILFKKKTPSCSALFSGAIVGSTSYIAVKGITSCDLSMTTMWRPTQGNPAINLAI